MKKSATNPVEILLIESNPQNVDSVKRMLNNTESQYRLHVENNLTGAFAFLQKEGENGSMVKPDMVFVNSDPVFDFGKEINNKTTLVGSPVMFLDITGNKIRVTETIDRHINFHSTEQLDIGYFIETIVSLKEFMGTLVKVPEMEMSY